LARSVLEVDTPILSAHATVDKHIESFSTGNGWLQTSPEFAMKRLLCAGSGPIYQICHVFRREESGRHHNPEFTLLEWYRPGYDHRRLMDEVEELLRDLGFATAPLQRQSYRDAFRQHAGLDPFTATLAELRAAADFPGEPGAQAQERDFWLDLIMSAKVGPRLGLSAPVFLYDFPASQAALSRVNGEVAERFELFWKGIELANGFHELADAAEQRQRFVADQSWRKAQGHVVPPYDHHLIAALGTESGSGLPDCAGVALGLDRLLMLMCDLPDIAQSMAFDAGRA
jgi:lysyl-tRNA synthetase class 2